MAIHFFLNDPKSFDPLCPAAFRMADGYRFLGKPGDPYQSNYIKLTSIVCCDCLYAGGQSLTCAHCAPCLVPVESGISIGRSTKVSVASVGGTQSLTFSGGPSAVNTWLAYIVGFGGNTSWGVPSGGSSWTQQFADTSTDYTRVEYKKCGSSEPSSYSVNYAGATKGDGVRAIVLEILNANPTNPVANNFITLTSNSGSTHTTPASVSSSNATNCAVALCSFAFDFAGGADTVILPPTGYTLIDYVYADFANGLPGVAIAVKLNCGTGTISPGSWTNHGSGTTTNLYDSSIILFGP